MKEYQINDKTVQLAIPVPRRVRGFLQLVGLKSLSELQEKAKAEHLGAFLIDLQLDEQKIAEAMKICLTDALDIEWADVPSEVINTVFTDFFVAVYESYKKAQRSMKDLL